MATKMLQIHRLRRVYVWEQPVRIYHWINALVMLALIATGFYIADPLALQSQHEATGKFTMAGYAIFILLQPIFSFLIFYSGYTGALWAINMLTGASSCPFQGNFLRRCGMFSAWIF